MNKIIKLTLCFVIGLTIAGVNKVSAANADIMDFKFNIYFGKYTHAPKVESVSYKFYAGTQKFDKSAYVLNTSMGINFSHYLVDKNEIRKSAISTHLGRTRSPYVNYAPKDTGFGCRFMASREHINDGKYTISGSWSADDKTK